MIVRKCIPGVGVAMCLLLAEHNGHPQCVVCSSCGLDQH